MYVLTVATISSKIAQQKLLQHQVMNNTGTIYKQFTSQAGAQRG